MSKTPIVTTRLTAEARPRQRAGGFLAERLRRKGWAIRDAAEYLGVSRQRLYYVFGDPSRARLWECAIDGMPVCSPELTAQLRAARAAKPGRNKPTTLVMGEFEIGDEVMATRASGLADEDGTGEIAAIRGTKKGKDLAILVRTDVGEDWFPEVDFHHYFAVTGLNRLKP